MRNPKELKSEMPMGKVLARVFCDLMRIDKKEEPIFETEEFYVKHPKLKEVYLEWLKEQLRLENF